MNSIVGSGTLITFPTLLALGYPPVVANVSNTSVWVWPGVFLVGIYGGSIIGCQIGVVVGRRLPPVLRGVIIAVGAVAIWQLL